MVITPEIAPGSVAVLGVVIEPKRSVTRIEGVPDVLGFELNPYELTPYGNVPKSIDVFPLRTNEDCTLRGYRLDEFAYAKGDMVAFIGKPEFDRLVRDLGAGSPERRALLSDVDRHIRDVERVVDSVAARCR